MPKSSDTKYSLHSLRQCYRVVALDRKDQRRRPMPHRPQHVPRLRSRIPASGMCQDVASTFLRRRQRPFRPPPGRTASVVTAGFLSRRFNTPHPPHHHSRSDRRENLTNDRWSAVSCAKRFRCRISQNIEVFCPNWPGKRSERSLARCY